MKRKLRLHILTSALQSIAPNTLFSQLPCSFRGIRSTANREKPEAKHPRTSEAYLLAYIFTFESIITISLRTVKILSSMNLSINQQTNIPINHASGMSAMRTFHRIPKGATFSISTYAKHFLSIFGSFVMLLSSSRYKRSRSKKAAGMISIHQSSINPGESSIPSSPTYPDETIV